MWDAHHQQVRRYLVRRVGRDDADDLTGVVFETAFRRLSDLPVGNRRLWWLLSCARKVCANHRRSQRRRGNLAERARLVAGRGGGDFAEQWVADAVVRQVLARLAPAEREVLLLAVWDDLDPPAIAVVLGISPTAAQKRVVRARRRFEKEYAGLSAEGPNRTLNGQEMT